jgi:hypothetical protein
MRPLPSARPAAAAALLLLLAAACSDQSPTTAAVRAPTEAPARLLSRPAIGQRVDQPFSVAAGVLAIRYRDGGVASWGSSYITPPSGLTGIVSVSAAYSHALGLRYDGTVAAWGSNSYGESTVPAGLSGVVAVAAGGQRSAALKSDGTVVGWGKSYVDGPLPASFTNVVAIGVGTYFTAVLKADGTVATWPAMNTSAITDAVAIAVADHHGVALKSDGTVVGFGFEIYTELHVPAGLTDVVDLATGWGWSGALKSDGTVVAWGDVYESQGTTNVPAGLSNVIAIEGTGTQAVALKSDGTLVQWGRTTYVQPGLVVRIPGSPGPNAVIAGLVNDTLRRYEGTKAVFSSSGSTDGLIGRATFTWTLDGTPKSQGVRYLPGAFVDSARFADQGTHSLTLGMTDGIGGSSTASAVLVITNALPVVSWSTTPSVTGKKVTVCPSFSDLGANDSPWSYAITWGDRATTTGSTATQGAIGCFDHTYTGAAGTSYTVVARVTDTDGGARATRYVATLP